MVSGGFGFGQACVVCLTTAKRLPVGAAVLSVFINRKIAKVEGKASEELARLRERTP